MIEKILINFLKDTTPVIYFIYGYFTPTFVRNGGKQ
jgi:hypothetical protein